MTLKEFREVANSLVSDYHYYLEDETGEAMNLFVYNREVEALENITNKRFLDCIDKYYRVVNIGATNDTVHVMCEKISQ